MTIVHLNNTYIASIESLGITAIGDTYASALQQALQLVTDNGYSFN